MSKLKYWIASEQIAAKRWPSDTLHSEMSEEILINYYNTETGAQLNGGFRFYIVQGEPTPRLELFEDTWLGLHELGSEFTAMLASLDPRKLGRTPTPADVVDGLKSIGFAPVKASGRNDSNHRRNPRHRR